MKELEIIQNLNTTDLKNWMADTWSTYYSSSVLGLRLEVNHLGSVRISKRGGEGRAVVWQGSDLNEALNQLLEQAKP